MSRIYAVSSRFLLCSLLLTSAQVAYAQERTKSNYGTLKVDDKTYKLEHGIAFETKTFDEPQVAVLLSSEPIPLEKLKASLKKKGNDDDLFLFQPQVKLVFDKSGKLTYLFIWADGLSINRSSSELKGEVAVRDGRAVGKASMEQVQDTIKPYRFDVSFELAVLSVPKSEPEPKSEPKSKGTKSAPKKKAREPEREPSGAGAIHVHDVPIPNDASDVQYKKLVQHIQFSSPSSVRTLAAFYADNLKKNSWKSASDVITDRSAVLQPTNGDATLTIFINAQGSGSKVTIMSTNLSWEDRNTADVPAAKAPTTRNNPPASLARGILAADLPVPDKAKNLKRDEDLEMISFESALDAKEVADFYRKKLAPLGWKEDKDETFVDATIGVGNVTFEKALDEVRVSILDGQPNSRSRVLVQGDGLVWSTSDADAKPAPTEPLEDVELVADDSSGFPIPNNRTHVGSTSTRYRKKTEASVPASLKSVIEFYRHELGERGWKELADKSKVETDQATLSFAGPEGSLAVQLRVKRRETVIELITRDPQKAEQDGVAPKAGQARLIMGNASTKSAVIVINGQEYKIAAGVGAKNPKDGQTYDIQPGKYTFEIRVPGQKSQTETLDIGPDQTWGIIVAPTGGYLADQVY